MIRLEQVRRQAELATLAAVMAGGEVPDPDELVDDFLRALAEPPRRPTQAEREQAVLMTALRGG